MFRRVSRGLPQRIRTGGDGCLTASLLARLGWLNRSLTVAARLAIPLPYGRGSVGFSASLRARLGWLELLDDLFASLWDKDLNLRRTRYAAAVALSMALGASVVLADGLSPAEQATARRIVAAALADDGAYLKLQELCDGIGHRLGGSAGLDAATRWALRTMRADGHENVRLEPVMVPKWVRGRESCEMVAPRRQPLAMLGLGYSEGTPPAGISAPVVVVRDKAELDALGNAARGKIVLFNNVMPPYTREAGTGYGRAVQYRAFGAQWAAEKGAVACLIRSVTARSLRSPHTGMMRYDDAAVRIPAAALAIEDAEMIARLAARGIEVRVNLKMEARLAGEAPSANVIAELRGATHPEEIVVIGGHIDSWDVGQGAHDDGAGCVMAMQALTLLRKLNLRPRRTIRVVLWTGEEIGLIGAKRYAEDHADELARHVAAIEADIGCFRPTGYGVDCRDKGRRGCGGEATAGHARRVRVHRSIGGFSGAVRARRVAAQAAWRVGAGARDRSVGLFRLSPHPRGHARQNQSARLAAQCGDHGRRGPRDRRSAGAFR
jgi:carboxypeptidase Q